MCWHKDAESATGDHVPEQPPTPKKARLMKARRCATRVKRYSTRSQKPIPDESEKNHREPPKRTAGNQMSGQTEHAAQAEDVLSEHLKENHAEYDRDRDALLKREDSAAWDANARRTASDAEKQAANITWKIREHERDNLFGNTASEAIPGPHTLDMGGQFLTNKERIEEESGLFKIAKMAPKGAHLHVHFNSELLPEQLMEQARELPNMFIRSIKPLTSPADLRDTEVVLNVLPVDTPSADIFDSQYNPDFKSPGSQPWMKWSDFSAKLREAFDVKDPEEWIRKKMVLTEDEVYNPNQTLNGVWARFNQGTRCFKGLLNYEKVYRWYIGEAIENMVRDKVMYAELRPMLMDKSIPTTDGINKVFLEGQMQIIVEETERKQQQLKERGEEDAFPFGLKIIYCTPRSIPKERMRKELADCISLKISFPDLICGFDLVGAEDRPNSIGYYREELLAFTKACKDLNIAIPFMFHAGETLLDRGGSQTTQNSNVYDALLLNAKRIGHGFSLVKHPELVEKYKKQNICIELCPTSNELLHLCRNVKEHPYPQLLAAGLHCTVNADNASLFRNSISHEFYQVMVGSTSMNLHGWRQLAEWSLEHSELSESEKDVARAIFKRKWEQFCEDVIKTYGPHADTLPVPDISYD